MSIIKLLSSAEAMAVYLIALMLIIALLGAVVLCALHLIRSNAEAAAAELGESKEDKKRSLQSLSDHLFNND